jgi:glycosyltransferase involved in cell wall biosynthesis
MSEVRTITCAIPVLNGAATLDWTVLSLRSQRGVDVNIVAVDSGSTDGTLDICSRWNVETRYAERGNMYRAVNAGLAGAATDWLTYLNADDTVYARSFAELLALAEKTNADVVYGDHDFVDDEGRFLFSLKSAAPHDLQPLFGASVMGLPQPGTLFKRTLYERLGGFSTDFRLTADADFFLRALQSGARFARLDRSVCAFRMHASQQTRKHATEMQQETLRVATAAGGRTAAARATRLRWRLANAANYLLRYLRVGKLRGTTHAGR